MGKQIWKYSLELGMNTVEMPAGAQILTAQKQHEICIWCIVDTAMVSKQERRIYIAGTGQPLPESADVSNWISTLQDGPYVWHVFEIPQ